MDQLLTISTRAETSRSEEMGRFLRGKHCKLHPWGPGGALATNTFLWLYIWGNSSGSRSCYHCIV